MAKGEVSVKDLREGIAASADIKDRDEWLKKKAGQFSVKRSELISKLKVLISEKINSPS